MPPVKEPWNVGMLVLGCRNLPKLDTFGLSDPYACISLLRVQGQVADQEFLQVDHDVSKVSGKEKTSKDQTKATIVPQHRTRVVRKTLNPRWAQIFQFREARDVQLRQDGTLAVNEEKVPISGRFPTRVLVTVHDRDMMSKDEFSGRLCMELKPNEAWEGEYPLLDQRGEPLVGHSGEQATILVKAVYSMAEYLDQAATEKHVEEAANEVCKCSVASMQGWRSSMEDAHDIQLALDAKAAFFGVYDGHGGLDVAKFSAKHVAGNVKKSPHFKSGRYEDALKEGFLQTDEQLLTAAGVKECIKYRKEASMARDARRKSRITDLMAEDASVEYEDLEDDGGELYVSEAGSTAVTCLLVGRDLYCANAGDSRAVLCRLDNGNPTAVELSSDHKPTKESEAQRIEASGRQVVEQRIDGIIAVSRGIGDIFFKTNGDLPAEEQAVTADPEIRKITLQDDDQFILLACDGIWDCFSSQAVIEMTYTWMNAGSSLKEVNETLMKRCLANDPKSSGGVGTDNMTCMIVQLKKPLKS